MPNPGRARLSLRRGREREGGRGGEREGGKEGGREGGRQGGTERGGIIIVAGMEGEGVKGRRWEGYT